METALSQSQAYELVQYLDCGPAGGVLGHSAQLRDVVVNAELLPRAQDRRFWPAKQTQHFWSTDSI
jgi:hypothetical protein